jgi:hypothetical protein
LCDGRTREQSGRGHHGDGQTAIDFHGSFPSGMGERFTMDGVMNAWGVQTGRQRYSVDWNWKARPSFAKIDAQHHKNQ